MTFRLILMRHAKSGWDDPTVEDFDRTLDARGRRSASAIGKWLRQKDMKIDKILSSAAARTKETYELVAKEIDSANSVSFRNDLYLASPQLMFETLRGVGDVQTVMMIAHNPGCAMLAEALVRERPSHNRFRDYPTCATTIIDFDDVANQGGGTVVDFVVPRDLLGSA
jgi:phosphohistidine phosphatase